MNDQIEFLLSGHPPAADAGLFGASLSVDEASVVLIPVPYDATASYGKGTAAAPSAIVAASHQLDLWDEDFGFIIKKGIAMDRLGPVFPSSNHASIGEINLRSERINHYVEHRSGHLLNAGKFVGVVGGDHAAPLGLLRALGSKNKDFGILHIDAHHDLREAYEGYTYSHASIMFNVLKEVPAVKKIVQVGVRDFSQGEAQIVKSSGGRVKTFYDHSIARRKIAGEAFAKIAEEIVQELPSHVYVSFDIDGLDPSLCPGTGTPVPGGLSFHEAGWLLNVLIKSGRKICGFDLCEVSPQNGDREWNANVGARILYKLCGLVDLKS